MHRSRLNGLKTGVLALALLVSSAPSWAEYLKGKVVSVADGDTITVLDATNTQHKIRLAGIDAPEKAQPFGEKSKQHLSQLAFDQQVTIDWQKRDRYQRIVGKVLVNGSDVNQEQLKAGLAWHYKKYQQEQSAEDRENYARVEVEAQRQKVGLWSDPTRIPPWDWRKAKRTVSHKM